MAMCNYGPLYKPLQFSGCNLFKRSFTNKGLGYTFNNEIKEKLFKKAKLSKFIANVMFLNEKDEVSKMMSPGSDEALNVLIENNAEERDNYEKTRYNGNTGIRHEHIGQQYYWEQYIGPFLTKNAIVLLVLVLVHLKLQFLLFFCYCWSSKS